MSADSRARKGILAVMAGGGRRRSRPPSRWRATRTFQLLGPAGAGQLAKMVNQICIAGLIGPRRGVHFARAAGLDVQAVIDVISKGAAQSWQMENRHATMIAGQYEHGFAVDWVRDLGYALDGGAP